MQRLLIIGASVLQLPGIRKAKEMGLHVGVVDFKIRAQMIYLFLNLKSLLSYAKG